MPRWFFGQWKLVCNNVIEPTMNVNRQTRMAVRAITIQLEAQELERACYLMDLLNEMLDTVNAGQPRPWSWFFPRYEEEFAS
jgi:hypothetical protein